MPSVPVTLVAALRDTRLRRLLAIWLGWAVILTGFQVFAPARLALQRPDFATAWTADETQADGHAGHPYLQGRVLNDHVAWDSEYYLSIAVGGYDDPRMQAVAPDADPGDPKPDLKGAHPGWVSLNAAFFPVYPIAMRIAGSPLRAFGLDAIAAATVAGVVLSLGGTLAAMLALTRLARDGDEADGERAAFYLLVMPASVFLAQVYTEGLFLGLSLGALVMLRQKRLAWAALLAVAATWTRATGALLLIPFLWTWWSEGGGKRLTAHPYWRSAVSLGLAISPALAYLAWRAMFGRNFAVVEEHYFGRAVFALGPSLRSWSDAAASLWNGPPAARAYYAVEFASVAIGLAVCLGQLRRDPALALYGLAIIAVALTSGVALGMHRYILGVPALYLVPARWGRSPTFDRLWTLGNGMVMAVFALAFSADFWAG